MSDTILLSAPNQTSRLNKKTVARSSPGVILKKRKEVDKGHKHRPADQPPFAGCLTIKETNQLTS